MYLLLFKMYFLIRKNYVLRLYQSPVLKFNKVGVISRLKFFFTWHDFISTTYFIKLKLSILDNTAIIIIQFLIMVLFVWYWYNHRLFAHSSQRKLGTDGTYIITAFLFNIFSWVKQFVHLNTKSCKNCTVKLNRYNS